MTLEQLYADFFRREGWPAVTNRPSDRGGLTRGGITFRDYNRWLVAHGERPLTEEEFKLLDQGAATAFLHDEFVRPLEFTSPISMIHVMLVDLAMNAGPDDAIKILQAELHQVGVYLGAIDGIPGPKTRAAWRACVEDSTTDEVELWFRLFKRTIKFTVRNALDAPARAFMAAEPKTQLHNLEGWINRRLEFL